MPFEMKITIEPEAWQWVADQRRVYPPDSPGGRSPFPFLLLHGRFEISARSGDLARWPDRPRRMIMSGEIGAEVLVESPSNYGVHVYAFACSLIELKSAAAHRDPAVVMEHRHQELSSGYEFVFRVGDEEAELRFIDEDEASIEQQVIRVPLHELMTSIDAILTSICHETEQRVPEAFDWPRLAPLRDYCRCQHAS